MNDYQQQTEALYGQPQDNSASRVQPQATDVEMGILGGAIFEEEAALTAFEILDADDFFKPAHQHIYATMVEMFFDDQPLDLMSLESKLQDKGFLETCGGSGYLMDLTRSVSSAANIDYHSQIVLEKSKRRKLIRLCAEVEKEAYQSDNDTYDVLDRAESRMFDLAQDKSTQDAVHVRDRLQDILGKYEEVMNDPDAMDGVFCGLDIDNMLTGFKPGKLYILAARPSMGKAQPLDAKVKTYDGWKRMGDIRVGDHLASIDGGMSMVEGVFPQGKKDIYEITFCDGRKTRATAEHLWVANNRKWKDKKVITTADLIEYLEKPSYKNRIWVDQVDGDFGVSNLPVDPWFLGFFIGDGRLDGTLAITTDDAQSMHTLFNRLPGYSQVNYSANYTYYITDPEIHGKNRLTDKLRALGYGDSSSYTKFIPKQYLNANKEDRMLLLQGLMDSDGWCEKSGTLRYSTSSKQLSRDFQELVRSLGGICGIKEKEPTYTHGGEKRQGETAYVCKPRFSNPEDYVTIHKKRQHANNGSKPRLNISSIEHVGREDAQCIKVTHPSHTYITDNYIVTHNTSLGLEIADGIADGRAGEKTNVGFFSLEMSTDDLVDRLILMESHINGQKARKGDISDEEFKRMIDASSRIFNRNIYVNDTPGISIMQLRSKVRHMVNKHDVGVILIDYLQLMTYAGRAGNREEEVTKISQGLKAISKEYEIPVIALAQLSRAVETRGGDKRPQLSDLRESGSIEQDADAVMFLYRPEYYGITTTPEGESTEGKAEVIVKKQRSGPTGMVPLRFMKDYAKFVNPSFKYDNEETAPF